jgi:uncharacterized protein YqgC (DUF456 family)
MTWLAEQLYPKLRAFPVEERKTVLETARKSPFDVIELIGIAVGLVVVTLLTRYGAAQWSAPERIAGAIVNFVVAIPLLGLFVAPFVVRRTRRALDAQLEEQAGK